MASEIALILQGKHRVGYDPRFSGADRVIVKNASKVIVTGRKRTDKLYRHHTGYIGHLKEFSYAEMMVRSPEKVLRHAIETMIPKNRLRKSRMKRLIIEK